jgi:hypothetical protein
VDRRDEIALPEVMGKEFCGSTAAQPPSAPAASRTLREESMKPIYSTNRNGHATATDNDGNRTQMAAPPEMSYEEGHAAVVERLCKKMDWRGTLHGTYRLKAGQTIGMVWLWDDEHNRNVVKWPK